MKFKVGDKVKVINTGQLYDSHEEFIKANAPQLLNKWECGRDLPDGGSYEVKVIGKHTFGDELAIIEQNNKVYIVGFEGLELVKQFTKSDLKDNHIVVYKNGGKLLWEGVCLKHEYTEDLIFPGLDDATINEVYEFDKLVYKREKQILDEVEKKYLSDVIRPFKNKIIWIKKTTYHDDFDEEWIEIETNKSGMLLPNFKKGTMYKNMEIYKEYSLKELGLE